MLNNGSTYNSLTVLELAYINQNYKRYYKCLCNCGNITIVEQYKLKSNKTTSCGCIARYNLLSGKLRRTHGESKTKLYKVWTQIKQRCNNPKDNSYHTYGAKGITMCHEWSTFEPFKEWCELNGYTEGLSIDRINNNAGYYPSNCRWVDIDTQANNRGLSKVNTTGYRHISKRGTKYIFRLHGKSIKRFDDLLSAVAYRDSYYTDNNLYGYIRLKDLYETK